MTNMFTYRTDFRKNTVEQWLMPDSFAAYKPIQYDGSPNYPKNAFDYRFNSDGFRCDEFSSPSSLPILFMGCSFTEGIGLPLDHTWPTFLIGMIKKQPGYSSLHIPHHSIALGGTGVDTSAAMLPKYAEIVKPKFIIGFYGSLFRRDFCAMSEEVQQWLHADTPIPYYKNEITKVFSDPSFALHQSFRSLQTIDLVAQLHNAKAYIIVEKHVDDVILPSSLFKSLEVIHYHNNGFVYPPHLENTPKLGRDNMHHGARWHYTLATFVADKIIPTLNPEYKPAYLPPSNLDAFHGVPFPLPGTTPPDPPLTPNPAVRIFKQIPKPGWLT